MALDRAKFRLPTTQQRTTLVGHTGCGKSQMACWYLSEANIETMPWVIVDYKGDDLIGQIPYTQEIGLGDTATKPGVHILRPLPGQEEHVDNFLWRLWQRGRTGLYVDEAYMLQKSKAYPAILTQGRSKHIPTINLTQKPSWVPSQVFSEADFFTVFHLVDKRDHKRVNEFAPVDLERQIPDYWSWHYRVKDRAKMLLKPVPDASSILDTFARRLAPKHRVL